MPKFPPVNGYEAENCRFWCSSKSNQSRSLIHHRENEPWICSYGLNTTFQPPDWDKYQTVSVISSKNVRTLYLRGTKLHHAFIFSSLESCSGLDETFAGSHRSMFQIFIPLLKHFGWFRKLWMVSGLEQISDLLLCCEPSRRDDPVGLNLLAVPRVTSEPPSVYCAP